jgi:hypothetical protein
VLAEQPPLLRAPHRAAVRYFLGERAKDLGDFEVAGVNFDRAFALNPNVRAALLASEQWTLFGDVTRARASLRAAQAVRPERPDLAEATRKLEAIVEHMTQDSVRAAHAGGSP